MISRRDLLRDGGLALAGLSATGLRSPMAPRPSWRAPLLVVIVMRGGADGLGIVVPHGERAYYQSRPSLAVPSPGLSGSAIDLDGYFGLHPRLAPLEALYRGGRMAVVHACGLAGVSSSHLEAQDALEAALRSLRRAVPPGVSKPRGSCGVPAEDAGGPAFPSGSFDRQLRRIVERAKAGDPPRVDWATLGGWDHHAGEGGARGLLATGLDELSRGVTSLLEGLAGLARDVVVVTVSEFGRAVAENTRGGTEHGRGTVTLVMGDRVLGGRVVGRWPGLDSGAGALDITTDVRNVLAEIASRHLGVPAGTALFPGHPAQSVNWPGVMADR